MQERQAVARELATGYRQKTKKERGLIVDELVRLTSYNRTYACRVLREAARVGRRAPKRRTRRRTYGPEVLVPLRKIWATMDGIAGKRLAPFLAEMVSVMERTGELHLSVEVREKLLSISAATIDRLLAADRRRLQIRGRSRTKPGTLLKHQIPIRTFACWEEGRPGFLEVDLVSHDGGRAVGDWIHTLSATDVATGWTETQAVKNKAPTRAGMSTTRGGSDSRSPSALARKADRGHRDRARNRANSRASSFSGVPGVSGSW